jgi:hypothetical protein
MQHVNHLSELVLDEWAAQELSGDESDRVAEHVASCPDCRARHTALEHERAAFLAAAPSFEAHAARFVRSARAEPGPEHVTRSAASERATDRVEPRRWLLRQRVLLAASSIAVMAAASLLVVWIGRPLEQTRAKGAPHIGWFVKRGEGVYRGRTGETLYPRDSLRFIYSSDEPRYLALFNLDARGATVYYPSSPEALRVRAGNDLALDFSVELDEQLGIERVYALFCESSFQVEPLRAALLETGRLPERAGCRADIINLHKALP